MKPLSGREASVLALLAQSRDLSAQDKKRILESLEGQALKIAKVMVGQAKNPAKSDRDAAEGFTAWANELQAG